MSKNDQIKESYKYFHSAKTRRSERFKSNARYSFLRDLMHAANGKVLVVGCGSRREMSILNEKCEGVGLDLSETAIEKARKQFPRFRYVVGDAQNMPFEDDYFDYIVCSEVIEHLPDDQKFIKEANRLLKRNGVMVLTTPNWISTWGLARKLGELVLRRPITAGGQLIDNWYTYRTLSLKVEKFFRIEKNWGIWYLPPFGLGEMRLPEAIEYPIFKSFYPFEKALRSLLPNLGHSLAFYLRKKVGK